MSSSFSSSSNELQKNRHITYWLRCLRTLLPTEYTSNESIRMTLAFFIISALDLLGVLQTRISPAERDQFKDWVYHCQHANGGFRGSPATFFGNRASTENDRWDPPNLAATYFALATLIVLGDDLKRVRMRECLEWLPRLQRADGSFGDVLGEAGVVDGGRDTRFCYCAAGVRWILRGEGGAKSVEGIRDIDVDALVGYINSSETYDHGISGAPYHEAHAGLLYCAIGALSFIDRLPDSVRPPKDNSSLVTGVPHLEGTVQWLVSRQTVYNEQEDSEDFGSRPPGFQILRAQGTDQLRLARQPQDLHAPLSYRDPEALPQQAQTEPHRAPDHPAFFQTPHPHHTLSDSPFFPTPSSSLGENLFAGFNGRSNKSADTCYSFWVGGSLSVLDRLSVIDSDANRRFLLEKTQHQIGGFGKLPGDVPDILHSYLGLAALAIMGEPGLKSLDPTLCISVDAREHLKGLSWWKGKANGIQ